jgi:hypothetical protein
MRWCINRGPSSNDPAHDKSKRRAYRGYQSSMTSPAAPSENIPQPHLDAAVATVAGPLVQES